jgi:hypothetical protein
MNRSIILHKGCFNIKIKMLLVISEISFINYNIWNLILLKGYPVRSIKLYRKLLISIFLNKWNHLLLCFLKICLRRKENWDLRLRIIYKLEMSLILWKLIYIWNREKMFQLDKTHLPKSDTSKNNIVVILFNNLDKMLICTIMEQVSINVHQIWISKVKDFLFQEW